MEKQDGMLSNVQQEDLKLLKENPENFWKRVNEIGPNAFAGLDSLESIEIPNTVTRIGMGAFENCKNLKSITIPESVEEISYAAFAECKSLTKVNLPESLCEIHFATFSGCESLTDIQIPKSVRMIESAAFQGCKNLKSITFPEYMSQIEIAAFENCTSLTKVNLPERVKEIGDGAFRGCSSLKEITIPEGVTEIDNGTFCGCFSLKEIIIPEGVTKIGNSAFWGCKNLETVKFPTSLTLIGPNAFSSCENLKEVEIPDNVRIIIVAAADGGEDYATFEKNVKLTVSKEFESKHPELFAQLKEEYGDKVVIKTAEQETIAEVDNQTKGESMEPLWIKPDDLLEEIKSEANIKSDLVSEPVEETAQPEVSVAEDISAEVVETPIVTNSPENPEVQENVVNTVIEEPVEVVEEPVEVAEVNPVEETAQPEVVNANEDGAEIEMPTEAKEENDLGKIFEKSGKEFTDGLIKFLGGFKNSKHEYNAILNAVGTWLAVEKTDAKAIAINETIMSFPKVAGVKIRDEIKAGIEDALLETKDLNEVGNGLNAWYVMDGADGIKSAKNVVLRVEEIKNNDGISEDLKKALTNYQFAYANSEERKIDDAKIVLDLGEFAKEEELEKLAEKVEIVKEPVKVVEEAEKAKASVVEAVVKTGGDEKIKEVVTQEVVHWREVEHKTIEEQLNAVVETTKEIVEKEQTDSKIKDFAKEYIKQEEQTIKLIAQAVYSSLALQDISVQKVENGYPVLDAQSVLEKTTQELNKMVKTGAIKKQQANEAFDLLYKAPLIGNAVLKAALYEGGVVIYGVKELKLKKGETLYKWVPNETQSAQTVVADPRINSEIQWDSGVEVGAVSNSTENSFENELNEAFENGKTLSEFIAEKGLKEADILKHKNDFFKFGEAYVEKLINSIDDATTYEEVDLIGDQVKNFCKDFKLVFHKQEVKEEARATSAETFNNNGTEASM